MKRPPVLMRLQIRGKERGFGLWLPVFLLLPVALLLVIILSPLIVTAIVILRRRRWLDRLPAIARTSMGILCSVRGVRAAFDVICSMPGLRVDVCNSNERVYVSII
jgi:threonine/homoserine/homoserine lactone efflux protein